MATDLIELEVVVRDKTLKQSLTTVSRLEREITKAAKAVDANTMSQKRYNQVLLSAKRQYEELGVSSQKATHAVRSYAAQVQAASTVTQKMTNATVAMGKGLNRNGVVMQQAGYQVGDFLVQVQSGTNVMVAFGQQATQMVGTFAMLARSTGAIALFSGLGIAIPILTAIGAAITRTSDETQKMSFNFKRFFSDVKEAFAPLSPLLSGIGNAVSSVGSAIVYTTNLIVKNIDTVVVAVGTLAVLFAGKALLSVVSLTKGFLLAANAVKTLTAALMRNPFTIIAVAVTAAAVGLYELYKAAGSMSNLMTAFSQLFFALPKLVEAAWYKIRSYWANGNAYIYDKLDELFTEYGSVFNQLGAVVQGFFGGVKAIWDKFPEVVANAAKNAANMFIDFFLGKIAAAMDSFSQNVSGSWLGEKLGLEPTAFSSTVDGMKFTVEEGGVSLGSAFADGFTSAYERSINETPVLDWLRAAAADQRVMASGFDLMAQNALDSFKEMTPELQKLLEGLADGSSSIGDLNSYLEETQDKADGADKALENLRKELENPLVKAIESVSDAWADFIVNGFKDFQGFVKSVISSFKNMIAQMIATATSNRIMLSLGLGGTATAASAGTLAGVGGAAATGSVGGFIGSFAGGGAAGTGMLGGFGAALPSALGGAGNGLFAVGANAAAAGGGIAATIGAVAAPLLAVAAVFSFFKKKTKELDSGIRGNVEGYDSLIESFQKIQTSRFFGLSKKTSTNATVMADDNPISQAITSVQMSVLQTAEYLGIATDALNDFSYDFNVSLKGLSEEAKAQKITEEVQKLGDAFAALLPNIQSLEQLTAIMNERYSLETRLLQVQGDTQALRDRELAATNEYNREILQQIYAAEDAAAATQQLNQALNALSENNFATLLDFNRAKAAMRMGEPVANVVGAPASPVSAVSPAANPAGATVAELRTMRAEMKEQHEEVMFAYSKITKNGKDTRDTLRSWDVVGLPAERTA